MSETAAVVIDSKKFAVLVDMRSRVEEAQSRYNASKEDTKHKKEAFDVARESFEREFDRLVRTTQGDDLPLFNQSEILERAQNDPVVTKLVERLLAADQDVNAILVAGYTQDERAEISDWLDKVEARTAAIALSNENADPTATVEIPEEPAIPAILAPQPLTAIEVADLIGKLEDANVVVTPEQIEAFGRADLAVIRQWLAAIAEVNAAKGDDVTVEDLPAVPTLLAAFPSFIAAESDDVEDADAPADEARQ